MPPGNPLFLSLDPIFRLTFLMTEVHVQILIVSVLKPPYDLIFEDRCFHEIS